MLAALTPETDRQPYAEQLKYFDIAIWMASFRNRYKAVNLPEGRYSTMLAHLRRSRKYVETRHVSVPGGPALRLAKAMWALDYRLMFPTDTDLIRAEEEASAIVAYEHRKREKSNRYPVWLAMEQFISMRTDLFGGIPDKASAKEDVFTPNPFTKALRTLDTVVHNHRRLRQRTIFDTVLAAVAAARPHRALLVPVLESALAYAAWLAHPQGDAEKLEKKVGYENLLNAQQRHIEHLHQQPPALNSAINKLLYEYRR